VPPSARCDKIEAMTVCRACRKFQGYSVAGGTLPYNLAKVGTKAKLRQQNQQEGAKKANSPEFKHIDRGS